jgi:nucleoside-diphosphate-sugar epimerase
VQTRVKERVQWPVRIPKVPGGGPSLDDRYVTVQVRQVFHSPAKLQKTLGWEPPLSYERGLETLAAWLRFAGVAA